MVSLALDGLVLVLVGGSDAKFNKSIIYGVQLVDLKENCDTCLFRVFLRFM